LPDPDAAAADATAFEPGRPAKTSAALPPTGCGGDCCRPALREMRFHRSTWATGAHSYEDAQSASFSGEYGSTRRVLLKPQLQSGPRPQSQSQPTASTPPLEPTDETAEKTGEPAVRVNARASAAASSLLTGARSLDDGRRALAVAMAAAEAVAAGAGLAVACAFCPLSRPGGTRAGGGAVLTAVLGRGGPLVDGATKALADDDPAAGAGLAIGAKVLVDDPDAGAGLAIGAGAAGAAAWTTDAANAERESPARACGSSELPEAREQLEERLPPLLLPLPLLIEHLARLRRATATATAAMTAAATSRTQRARAAIFQPIAEPLRVLTSLRKEDSLSPPICSETGDR
jgi:hypothetical protein